MQTNDISIAFISWPGGGKRRPIYIISDENQIVRFYKITSQYRSKSVNIKRYYFKINQWSEAGLSKQSYIDTITVGRIDKGNINLRVIGKLTEQDAERLVAFLSNQQ